MCKIKISEITGFLLALSMLVYAFRGKVASIVITVLLFLFIILLKREKRKKISRINVYATVFLLVFAVILHICRTVKFEYYLNIGYLSVVMMLLITRMEYIDNVWKWLGRISIFSATGVYLQFFFPKLYYPIIAFLLSVDSVEPIKTRLLAGYYTGFSREVSYTMFLVVVGLGLYLYNPMLTKTKRYWVPIVYLLGALFMSGKRATLVFFILAFFLTQFIKSDSKVKILKYLFLFSLGGLAVWVTYPFWSKLPIFDRMNKLVSFFSSKDIIGITNGRILIYDTALQLWRTNKWFGIGWGNFKYSVNNTYWYSGFDVHNCFLQILCENGIIGLVFYSLLCMFSLTNGIRALLMFRKSHDDKNYRLAVFCCYIQFFFVLYSLTEPILYEYTDYMVFFICYSSSNTLLKNKATLIYPIYNQGGSSFKPVTAK